VPGMDVRVLAPQGQFLLERILGTEEGITVEVRGFDLATLDLLAEQAMAALGDVPGITDLDLRRTAGTPELELVVDRDKTADLGLNPRQVTEVLETAMAGSRAGWFRSEGQSYRIFVQLAEAEQQSPDDVLDLVLINPAGRRVALRNMVQTRSGEGPALIERKDQQRLLQIQANIAGRDMGAVAADMRAALAGIVVPEGYAVRLAGNVEEQEKASREFGWSLLLALVFVYMVLACQYESLRDPLIVMAAVPLAAIGVLATLYLTGTTLNMQSYIGCIVLGGIVVNNAILLVDQAARLMQQGLDAMAAVAEAGRRRLRPILMTTLTTALALMPLALGLGEGADAQAPMARVVVGGLVVSALITLVLIPVIFSLVHGGRRKGVA
jgi:hydrophobic/amphiphilic exporter-1 (mainly G- bacteria), HAE1 family